MKVTFLKPNLLGNGYFIDEQRILNIFSYILKIYKPKKNTTSIGGFKNYCLKKFRHCEGVNATNLVSVLSSSNQVSKNFNQLDFQDLKIIWWH